MKRRLVLSTLAICLLSIALLFMHAKNATAASVCNAQNECTNPISVTIKAVFVKPPNTSTPIAHPTTAEIPSSVSITLNDGLGQFGGTNPNLTQVTSGKPTISGNTATYIAKIPPTLLTTDQWECDYTGSAGGCSQSIIVCAASFINTEAELANGNDCTKPINGANDPSGTNPPPNTIQVTLSGTNVLGSNASSGAATPAGCEGNPGTLASGTICPSTTYPFGCYGAPPTIPGASDVALSSCPSGATDNNGNSLTTASCYVAGTPNTWDAVSCSNLTTPVSINTASTSASSTPELQCTISILNPLTWLVCPVITAAESFVGQLDNAINDLLNVDVNTYLDQGSTVKGNSGTSFYEAWATFRGFALGLIVAVSLIIIIAQAIGVEAVSAYSIRKLLPRLLIAIIAISLSWDLMKFFVQLSDDVGHAVSGLIYAPFSGAVAKINSGAISGLAVVGAGGLLVLGIVGALSFVLTAAIAVLVGFATLVLRKILILTLVILAPIAIACAILPNTQKAWKLWSDNFMRALIMFPLIAGFIALGRVFAVISGSGGSGLEDDIIKLVAWFGPYFMIPATFKMAGGIMGGVGSFAGNISSKARQPFAGFRTNRAKERIGRAQSNQLWNPNTRRGKYGNNIASWVTSPHQNLAILGAKHGVPGLSGSGNKLISQIQGARMEQSANLLKELNETGMFNDKAYRALSGAYDGFNNAKVREGLVANKFAEEYVDDEGKTRLRTLKTATSFDDINTMANILAEGGNTERLGANALRGSSGRLASLYSDPEMGKAGIQAAGIMGLSSHGFASGTDLANVANQLSDSGKNVEYAQAITSRAQVIGQQQRPDLKAGYGVLYKTNANGEKEFVSGMTDDKRSLDLIKTLSSHDLAAAKAGAIETLKPAIEHTLDAGGSEAQAVEDQLFSWAGPYSQASVAVKTEALEIIDRRSGGRKPQIRQERSVDGTIRDVSYMGYDAGTIGRRMEDMRRVETNPQARGEGGEPPGGGGEPPA